MEDCGCSNNVKDFSKPFFTTLKENLTSILVTIKGENFNYSTLNGLYLSSNNYLLSTIELNLFTNVKSISSKFPAISGFPLIDYKVNKIKLVPYDRFDLKERYDLEFTLPSYLLDGNYDVIFINNAGYSKASDSKNFTYFKVIDNSPTPTPTPTITPTITPHPSQTPYPSPTPTNTPTSSTPILSYVPSINVSFITENILDNDNDGYSNDTEITFGTDPNNINDYPLSLYNVFNNV